MNGSADRTGVLWAALAAAATAVIGGIAIHLWLRAEPPLEFDLRLPGPDAGSVASAAAAVNIEGRFESFDGAPSGVTSAWPRFRGPAFDGISRETVPLADAWPSNGPPVLWSLDLGDGHAGPAVRHGRVYLLDYDESRRADVLRCFSFDNGRELWRRGYEVEIKRNHGISRTVPAVSERHVVSIGPRCHVLCVDALTGEFRWGIDMVREYGAKEPLWYTAQCPLLDGETAILAPCGSLLMMAVDAATGRVLWQTPNPEGWAMSHASIMPMEFGGRRMYVYPAIGGIAAVAADGPDAGALLWSTAEWKATVQAPSVVPLPGGRLLVTAGYGAGSAMFRLIPDGPRFRVELVWRAEKNVFASEQQTPIFYRDHVFSVLPNDAGAHRRQLICYHPDGRRAWLSGAERRFGLGPLLVADDRLVVLDDEGTLTMVRATPDRYEELARATVLPGARDSWGPMAIADGRLLVRESKKLICLDLRKQP